MRIVGLIAEYNPFHNGHKYHIEKAKELANADYAIVIMNPTNTRMLCRHVFVLECLFLSQDRTH